LHDELYLKSNKSTLFLDKQVNIFQSH
jgi:hypothetical protein